MTFRPGSFVSARPSTTMVQELNARGYIDHGTVVPMGRRSVRVEVLVLANGSFVKADSRVVAEVARAAWSKAS